MTNFTFKEVLVIQLLNRAPSLIGVESSLMILINLISAVGNITLCYVIYKTPSLQTKTNTYIIALAVSDTLMALLVMPLTVGVLIHGKWIFGGQVCQIQGFLSLSLGMISLQTMSLIAINRYFCVVRPSLYPKLFGKKQSLAMMVGIWIAALVTALAPLVLQIGSYNFLPERASCFIVLPDLQINMFYTSFSLFIFILLPFSVMVYCYALVFRKIHQHNTNNSVQAAADGRAEEIKTTRLLFFLVVGFSACWIPWFAIELSEAILPEGSLSRSTTMANIYLGYLSSAINPVLYGALNRPFRKATVRLFSCCRKNNVVNIIQAT